MLPETWRREAPLILSVALVGASLGGLLVGYEPVGGDPDRMYRPLKSELARALGEGRLPFWSERFGLGLPLVAESHVAAFYPPNLGLYSALSVSTAYRLAMWLHYLALVGATYFYARCLGSAPWGSALAAAAFTLCGFQAIHSSHEPFYHLMPYLPLALGIAERYLATGSLLWLAFLSPTLGLQWTLGHFQIQTWTSGLVILTGLWRVTFDRRPRGRAVGLIAGTILGAALAAGQLGLSWEFARLVGQTRRPVNDLLFYGFPPAHWFDLALPQLVRGLRQGPEDPYWFGQQTTGYEAALYIGTVPLIFGVVGYLARPFHRSTLIWRVLVPVSFALATMPQWWPEGYQLLLTLPGLGYFRAPARYTLLTSLGLAVLAAEGFDRSLEGKPLRRGLMGALAFGACASLAAFFWTTRADVHLSFLFSGVAAGILWAALAWSIAWTTVLAWHSRRLGSWAPIAAAALELAVLYYAGTTDWGWTIALPAQSPILQELSRQRSAGLIGGELGNLPVRANLKTGYPYIGFTLPQPDDWLKSLQEPLVQGTPRTIDDASGAESLKRWLRRLRVTHLVGHHRSWLSLGREMGRWRDPASDRIVYHAAGEPERRGWSIIQLDEPFPEARVALRARTAANRRELFDRLARSDERETAWFLAKDQVPDRLDAHFARLVSWDGSVATVEHDGPCDLVIARTFDPGWRARIDDRPERPVVPVDGGLHAVRLDGEGVHRVSLRYQPPRLTLWTAITLLAVGLNLGLAGSALLTRWRGEQRPLSPRPHR
jgi:hypothetical protein